MGAAGSHGDRFGAYRYRPAVLAYRVRDPSLAGLVYVGQGQIRTRLRAHLAKALRPEYPQARWFGVSDLECSWIIDASWLGHQRLELENDLIAAHVLEQGTPPTAQFLG